MQVQEAPRLESMPRDGVSMPVDFFHGILKLAALVPPGYTSMFIWHLQQNPGSAPQNQVPPAGNSGAESQIQGSPAGNQGAESQNPGSAVPDPDSTLHNPSVTTADDSSQCKLPRDNSFDVSLSSISGPDSDTRSGCSLDSTVPDTWAQFWVCVQHFLSPLFPVARDQHLSGLGSHEGSLDGGDETTIHFCRYDPNGDNVWSW